MMECWTASELVMLLNAVAVCSRSLCIPLFLFPTDAAWRLRAPMASRLYNSLDDVPLCMRSTHAVQVRYSDNYTDVPLCLPNPTPSFQVQTMTPPEQTFDYAGTFTNNARFTIYSRTHCNVTSLG